MFFVFYLYSRHGWISFWLLVFRLGVRRYRFNRRFHWLIFYAYFEKKMLDTFTSVRNSILWCLYYNFNCGKLFTKHVALFFKCFGWFIPIIWVNNKFYFKETLLISAKPKSDSDVYKKKKISISVIVFYVKFYFVSRRFL